VAFAPTEPWRLSQTAAAFAFHVMSSYETILALPLDVHRQGSSFFATAA